MPPSMLHGSTLLADDRLKQVLQFYHAYRSLCPSAWCERWDDQRGKLW